MIDEPETFDCPAGPVGDVVENIGKDDMEIGINLFHFLWSTRVGSKLGKMPVVSIRISLYVALLLTCPRSSHHRRRIDGPQCN